MDGYDRGVEENDISHDLDEVDFPTKFRGYDPVEVDGILERARREILDSGAVPGPRMTGPVRRRNNSMSS